MSDPDLRTPTHKTYYTPKMPLQKNPRPLRLPLFGIRPPRSRATFGKSALFIFGLYRCFRLAPPPQGGFRSTQRLTPLWGKSAPLAYGSN